MFLFPLSIQYSCICFLFLLSCLFFIVFIISFLVVKSDELNRCRLVAISWLLSLPARQYCSGFVCDSPARYLVCFIYKYILFFVEIVKCPHTVLIDSIASTSALETFSMLLKSFRLFYTTLLYNIFTTSYTPEIYKLHCFEQNRKKDESWCVLSCPFLIFALIRAEAWIVFVKWKCPINKVALCKL